MTEPTGLLTDDVAGVPTGSRERRFRDVVTVHRSNGSTAGQEVFYAHVHVVPRCEGDALELDWPAAPLSPGDGERRANEIRSALEDGVLERP